MIHEWQELSPDVSRAGVMSVGPEIRVIYASGSHPYLLLDNGPLSMEGVQEYTAALQRALEIAEDWEQGGIAPDKQDVSALSSMVNKLQEACKAASVAIGELLAGDNPVKGEAPCNWSKVRTAVGLLNEVLPDDDAVTDEEEAEFEGILAEIAQEFQDEMNGQEAADGTS